MTEFQELKGYLLSVAQQNKLIMQACKHSCRVERNRSQIYLVLPFRIKLMQWVYLNTTQLKLEDILGSGFSKNCREELGARLHL